MADTALRPRRLRILRTGWRLASAQVAFVLALLVLVILGGAALVFPSKTMWTVAFGLPLFFAVLGGILLATCKYLVVDFDAGEVTLLGGEVARLADWRAVVAVGQAGNAVTGSGRPYQYEVWSLGALTDEVGPEVLDMVAEAGRGEALPDPGGFTFLIEATTKGFVPLIDAASEGRVAKTGGQLAEALGIPYVQLQPPEVEPLTRVPPPSPEMGSAEYPG